MDGQVILNKRLKTQLAALKVRVEEGDLALPLGRDPQQKVIDAIATLTRLLGDECEFIEIHGEDEV